MTSTGLAPRKEAKKKKSLVLLSYSHAPKRASPVRHAPLSLHPSPGRLSRFPCQDSLEVDANPL